MLDFQEGMSEDAKAQLLKLKDLTMRTGVLVEAQILQLRLWPYVVFDLVEMEAQWDVTQKTVRYVARFRDRTPSGEDLKKKCGVLEKWLWTLLGGDWLLEVAARVKKGSSVRTIYRGTRVVPFTPKEGPKADLRSYEYEDAMTEFKRYRIPDKKMTIIPEEALPPITAKENK